MKRDPTKPSREGVAHVRSILGFYVKGMINDGDYARLERELLDVISAERALARQDGQTRPSEEEQC